MVTILSLRRRKNYSNSTKFWFSQKLWIIIIKIYILRHMYVCMYRDGVCCMCVYLKLIVVVCFYRFRFFPPKKVFFRVYFFPHFLLNETKTNDFQEKKLYCLYCKFKTVASLRLLLLHLHLLLFKVSALFHISSSNRHFRFWDRISSLP